MKNSSAFTNIYYYYNFKDICYEYISQKNPVLLLTFIIILTDIGYEYISWKTLVVLSTFIIIILKTLDMNIYHKKTSYFYQYYYYFKELT